METAEMVEIRADHLTEEMLKIKCQLNRLDDLSLSVDDYQVEQDLRSISAEIRQALDVMQTEFEPDEPWLAG